MQFHTVKAKISTTRETLKLELMRFQTSLNRAPAPPSNNLDWHQLLGKKGLFLHLDYPIKKSSSKTKNSLVLAIET